jgi:hypothetical protein
MEGIGQWLVTQLQVWIPRIVAALLILLIGWIIARVLAGVTRRLLKWMKLDERLAKGMEGAGEKAMSLEEIIVKIVYWLIIFLVILAALNALGFTAITALFGTMLATVFAYLPRFLYAAGLAVVAWIVARILKAIVTRVLHTAGADKKVTEQAGMEEAPISSAIGEAVYWLVWLLFLPAILGVLGLVGILAPIQAMITDILAFLPKLAAAIVILVVGLFVARILQRIITSALHALGLDAISDRIGLGQYLGKGNLSGLLGLVVYIIVFIPIAIAALNVLGLTYLAQPMADMLTQVLLAIPKIFMAIVVLFIAYMVARVIADLVTRLLTGAGFDKLVARMSMGEISETPSVGPSRIVGYLILFVIMLFATLAVVDLLGWTAMTVILTAFIAFLARLALSLIIVVIGIYLANLVTRLVMASQLKQKSVLALLARIAIIVFAIAMALDQLGVANDVVNLTFGLLLAAAALAAALAFGLGGTDVAKFQLVRWYRSAEASLAQAEAKEAATPPTATELPPADLPPADLPDTDLPNPTL